MIKIEQHRRSDWQTKKESEWKEFFQDHVTNDLRFVNKIRQSFGANFSGIPKILLQTLGYSNLNNASNYTYNYLYYANQLNYAWFQFTINDSKLLTLTIADKQINTTGKFKNENIGSYYVMQGMQTALILRDKEALAFYSDISLSFTEQANQEDIIYETMMLFYQVLLKETGTPLEAAATYKQLQSFLNWEEYKKYVVTEGFNQEWVWQIVFEGRKQYAEYVLLPVLDIYHHILTRQQTGYEAAVVRALEKWKAYFTLRYKDQYGEEEDHSLRPDGYLSLPILAACSHGYDRGFKLTNLESDYIPNWLIEGDFAGMELLIKD